MIQVGAGFWGASWPKVVHDAPEATLVALADPDGAALARVGEAAGIPPGRRFPSLAAAAASVEADAALIVVPPALHAGVALEALEAGLHCLVEKPFATSLEDARAVVARAESLGRTIMVSQNLRFTRGARTVRGLVAAGAVGAIGAVYVRFERSPSLEVGGFRAEMAEPLVLDTAIHHLDAVRGVLGLEPTRVRARSFNPAWSAYGGNAAAVVEIETAQGAPVFYAGSLAHRGSSTAWEAAWDVQGELGALRWEADRVLLWRPDRAAPRRRRRRLRRCRKDGYAPVPLVPLDARQRAGSLAELAAALREGREPEASGRDNLASLALALGAAEAARRGQPVDLLPLGG